jgi:hypothetical protein
MFQLAGKYVGFYLTRLIMNVPGVLSGFLGDSEHLIIQVLTVATGHLEQAWNTKELALNFSMQLQ